MFVVLIFDEATMEDLMVAHFDTEAEAQAYIADCNAEDVLFFGEVVDTLWYEWVA